jgi:hypothetical protein
MKWIHICQDSDSITEAMEVGKGVIVRMWSLETETIASTVFVPNVYIQMGSGEKTMIVSRTCGRQGPL